MLSSEITNVTDRYIHSFLDMCNNWDAAVPSINTFSTKTLTWYYTNIKSWRPLTENMTMSVTLICVDPRYNAYVRSVMATVEKSAITLLNGPR